MRKALPWIYLGLSVLGAILPWKANLEFIAESGARPLIWHDLWPMHPAPQQHVLSALIF